MNSNYIKAKFAIFIITVLAITNTSCTPDSDIQIYSPTFSIDNTEGKNDREYIFGVHPLYNPQRLHEVFSPLMAYLSNHIDGATFKLEASRNYAAYDKKLYGKKFDFSLPNPYQTVNAVKLGYKIFGKMADDHNFRGIILVRKDSRINKISDLKGKVVTYPAPTALAATMMPQYYIQSHGVDVMTEIDNRYVGSQESSIMNVFLKHSSAAATWPLPWNSLSKERPEIAEQLSVKWQTDSLPNNSLVVQPSISKDIVDQVSSVLFNMHKVDEGKVILTKMSLSSFEKADNSTYEVVSRFLEKFNKEVRSIE